MSMPWWLWWNTISWRDLYILVLLYMLWLNECFLKYHFVSSVTAKSIGDTTYPSLPTVTGKQGVCVCVNIPVPSSCKKNNAPCSLLLFWWQWVMIFLVNVALNSQVLVFVFHLKRWWDLRRESCKPFQSLWGVNSYTHTANVWYHKLKRFTLQIQI